MYQLQICWQYAGEGIRVLRIYSNENQIYIPETLGGRRVTEIGPYCFSPSSPRRNGDETIFYSLVSREASSDTFQEVPAEAPTLPSLEGRYVETILLPFSVRVLHNAAFYNCRSLHTLRAGSRIRAIGSDVFTNCTHLACLLYEGSGEADSLALILGRIETDLEVFFLKKESILPDPFTLRYPADSFSGALFFPEYYEWLDEVSPAHLFSRSIHGEGYRMRRCFQNHAISYSKYDACFRNALQTESKENLCRIALDRLRWPLGLDESVKKCYEEAVLMNFDTAFSLAAGKRDLSLAAFLFKELSPGTEQHGKAVSTCIEADWGEGAAFLMDMQSGQSEPVSRR